MENSVPFKPILEESRTYCSLQTINIKVTISACKQSKRKVQRVQQSQTVALLRHQEEEEKDKPNQAQIKQPYEKH